MKLTLSTNVNVIQSMNVRNNYEVNWQSVPAIHTSLAAVQRQLLLQQTGVPTA